MKRLSLLLAAFVLTGCSGNVDPGKNPDPIELSGRVTMGGKPVSDVTLNFMATGAGAEATAPVKNGEFKASIIPGRYTYFISEGSNPAAYSAIPVKFRAGSLDRQIDVAAGSNLTLTLD